MVDPLLLTTLATSVIALGTALLTHIRYSSCWGMNCRTRGTSGNDSPVTPITHVTPLIQKK
jgi:hypothetical protein